MMDSLRKYILCSSQRSGSTVFCRLLRMTGVLGAPSEYLVLRKLEPDASRTEADDLAKTALDRLREHATPNGITGVKLHYHQFAEFTGRVPLETLGKFDLWVYIDRRDIIAQAVSLARARQTRQYSSRHDAQGEASYSFDLIVSAKRHLEHDKAGWHSYFEANNVRPRVIAYEDIIDDPEGAVGIILESFGVTSEGPVSLAEVKLSVQRTAESLEWADRFRAELKNRQSGASQGG